MERWEDEQLQTLELALGFPPGTITAADIEYLIRRSCAEYYDDSEDDDLCFSMQHFQIGEEGEVITQLYENRSPRKKSSSSNKSSSSSHSKNSGSASSSDQKRTSRSTTTHRAEKPRGHHHRRK